MIKQYFLDQLQDAVAKIKITPDFTIIHTDYEPLPVPQQYQDYVRHMPTPQRDRYLLVKLQKYLYAIFNGEIKPKQDSAGATKDLYGYREIVNYEDKWYKTHFYHQLTECNHGQGYQDPDWLVVATKAPNQWKISKNGLHLYIDPEKHLVEPNIKLQINQTVSIKMPSNLVERGFYIAVGDAGSTKSNTSNRQDHSDFTIVQLYFHVNSDGALRLLDRLTRELNTLKITFDFKIAYDVASFALVDAAVLEFKSVDFARLFPIIKDTYEQNRTYFYSEIPFFCKYLASGLSLAEKPRQVSNVEFNNIGQYYCSILAKVLLATWQRDHKSHHDKFNYVLDCLSKENVDINYLYLNPNSIDIYGSTVR